MAKDYWIVWNAEKTEGVIMDNEADAKLTARGYDALEKAMRQGESIPSLGHSFSEWQDGEMTIQPITI